ncbi:MAG TPA: iron chelate uptake ABC transporter family permease subunit [Acidimicrobiales bacterium]|nr:iron chelate uptake ABC transporter family permease subunit [Acidimicrobiales bacterium]
MVTVRVPGLGWSARLDLRAAAVTAAALVLALAVFVWSLAVGDFPLSVGDVVAALLGGGDRAGRMIVTTLRLPRGLAALLVGAAFGLSGAILQRLARNPLASPDVIGVNAGAALAAVFAIVLLGAGGTDVTLAALAGGGAAALAVAGLSWRGGITGYRLVLVGVGVTAVLTAGTSYLLTRARVYEAQRAMIWLTGSLNGRTWDQVRPVALALAVLVPAALVLARSLRTLELGDDAARGLGVAVDRARGGLFAVAVTLAAVATASAGPIAFVALVAPQIARRLVRARTVALLPSAAVGALLLAAADLVGRRIVAPTELPVGIVTAVLGAPYLLYLLARANRIGAAG